MLKSTIRSSFRRGWMSLPQRLRHLLFPDILAGIASSAQFRHGIPTLDGVLGHLKEQGFGPGMIVDIGAFIGDWSRAARSVFPDTPCLMIDGNPDNRERLALAVDEIKNCDYAIALLGPENKDQIVFHVLGTGSSILSELTSFERSEKLLPLIRLDDLMMGRTSNRPLLLKLDVQGFELEVLRGAPETLSRSEVVILETSLLQYNEGAPLFSEVVRFMSEAGFMVYDFCGQIRRDLDGTLFQTDVVFARAESPLRARKTFWSKEPRGAEFGGTVT